MCIFANHTHSFTDQKGHTGKKEKEEEEAGEEKQPQKKRERTESVTAVTAPSPALPSAEVAGEHELHWQAHSRAFKYSSR